MTAEQLARKYARRAEMVRTEFRKTARGLGISALRFTKQKLTELIYGLPVPKRKSGKPEWRRTGHLRRSERWELVDDYTVRIINDASYAVPRHEAGKPGRRRVRYPAHWRDELVETFRPIVLEAYQITVRDILKRS